MDRTVLYCVLAFVILSPVELKSCPPDQYLVRVSVKVDFKEASVQKASTHYKESRSDSSFKEKYDSLDVSASVSGGGGGFSAEASAAYSDVASSASSSSNTREVEKNELTEFKPGFLQIIREVTRTIHIGGISSKTITKDFTDSVSIENDLSAPELEQRADDYLQREFGHSTTGKIQGSTFTEETCIKKKKGCSYQEKSDLIMSGLVCGTVECQFKTFTEAKKFCTANPTCTAILKHPAAGTPNCAGGLGCFTPRSGDGQSVAADHWKNLGGITYKKDC